jgi:hypothetical protein
MVRGARRLVFVWLLVATAVWLLAGLVTAGAAQEQALGVRDAGGTPALPAKPATLVAVQMQVRLEDYQSPQAFAAAVQRYMKAAGRTRGDGPRLVAFPEDVGLGLIFVDDYDAVRDCRSIFEAAYVLMNLYWPDISTICAQYGCSPTRALLLLKGLWHLLKGCQGTPRHRRRRQRAHSRPGWGGLQHLARLRP